MKLSTVVVLSLTSHFSASAQTPPSLLDALRASGASVFADQIEADPTIAALYLSDQVQTVFAPIDSAFGNKFIGLGKRQNLTPAQQQALLLQSTQAQANIQSMRTLPGGAQIVTKDNSTLLKGKGQSVVSDARPKKKTKATTKATTKASKRDFTGAPYPLTWTASELYPPKTWTTSELYPPKTWTTSELYPPKTWTTSELYLPKTWTASEPYSPTIWTSSELYLPETQSLSKSYLPTWHASESYPPKGTASELYPPKTWTTSELYPPKTWTTSELYLPKTWTASDSYPPTWALSNSYPPTGHASEPYSLKTWASSNSYPPTWHASESYPPKTWAPSMSYPSMSTPSPPSPPTMAPSKSYPATSTSSTPPPPLSTPSPTSLVEIFSGLGNSVNVIQGDIPYAGGLIQLTDGQFTLPASLSVTLQATGETTFASLASSANLTDTLDNTPFSTFFIPSNGAFANADTSSPTAATASLLEGHVIPNFVGYLPNLVNGSTLTTQTGSVVTVTIQGNNYFINNALIISSNLILENGVAHVIDQILAPAPKAFTGAASSTIQKGSIGALMTEVAAALFLAMIF